MLDIPSQQAEVKDRQRWMRILAMAPGDALERNWEGLDDKPEYTVLRAPEIGTAMVRARAGGSGAKFNTGEMTITRCAVCLADGTTGFAYAAGRDKRKVELAAAFDAMLQGDWRDALENSLIAPLEERQNAVRKTRSHKVAATKVDFFTMVRGED